MNRLLRTVATIASGLAAIAGNHAALPDPAEGTGSWFNPLGLLNLVVLLGGGRPGWPAGSVEPGLPPVRTPNRPPN
jgi:hypothetical protein